MIRPIPPDEPLSAPLAPHAPGKRIPLSAIHEVIALHDAQEERDRKLSAAVTLVLCIAMNLYAQEALPAVFRRLVSGVRWLWPERQELSVRKSAISQARSRLGAKPLV